MTDDPNQMLYDFRLDLERFGAEVENGALKVFHAAAKSAAEAIVVGNDYGPGVPVDTGFARSSFGIGINSPAQGPTEPPLTALARGIGGNKYLARLQRVQTGKGLGQISTPPMLGVSGAVLGDTVFITTMAKYPQYLEFYPKQRRFGKNKGASTEFIFPVEARWPQIVDDAAARVGYGA